MFRTIAIMRATLFVGFVLVTQFSDCISKTAPLFNMAVKVGENITMRCEGEGAYGVQWMFHNPEKKIFNPTEINSDLPRHFFVNSSSPKLQNLSIVSIQLNDSGRYQCIETTELSSSSAELIVLAADPRCGIILPSNRQGDPSVEGDIITFECKVTYSGSWAPSARWQYLDDNGKILSEQTTTETSANYEREKELRFVQYVNVTRNLEGTKYKCTIHFDLSQKSDATTADNIPDYNFTWTFNINSLVKVETSSTGVYQDGGSSDNVWIFALVSATVGCILLLIINIVIIVACHAKTNKGVAKHEATHTPSPTPDILWSSSNLNGSSYNELSEFGSPQTKTPDEYLQTTIQETYIDEETPTYAELAESQNRHLSRSTLTVGHVAANNAVYASIDHTIVSTGSRKHASQRSKYGSRR